MADFLKGYCAYCKQTWVLPYVFSARCPTCKGKLVEVKQ